MVRIQLETGYLEVKEGTNFPLNFGVADIRDISKRSGAFSKTITLVGSDNNNQLLNHYYDVNIESGDFDVNALTKCAVLQNGVPILEDAYLQLISVNKSQHSDGYEEDVEYSVLIKDAQSDFFTKLDNKELTDLDFSDLDHTYSAANVVTSFSNDVTGGYVYPVTVNPTNNYQLTDFKPAIYAKLYWDRIHSNAGFSYTWTNLSSWNFDKLVVPYNGDVPKVDYTDYLIDETKSAFTATLDSAITSWTEVTDDQNIFNNTTGVYSVPFYVGQGQSINFQVTTDIDVKLTNSTGSNAYLVDMISSGATQSIKYKPRLDAIVNSNIVSSCYLYSNTLAPIWETTDNPLPNGTTTLASPTFTGNLSVSNVTSSDTITFQLHIEQEYSLSPAWLKWKDSSAATGNNVTITESIYVTDIEIVGNVGVSVFGFGQTVEMNSFIPDKIKQKDFIKSMCTLYNLFAEPDPDNPNKIIYKVRDTYYDEGTEKDWTAKLAKERPQSLQFLPELSAKKLILTYKEDSDPYNSVYKDATNEIYGQVEYTYQNEYVKGIDKKELIFSPTPIVETTFNAYVPSFIGAAPKNNLRLLLHNGTATCGAFNIYNYSGSGSTGLTSYPIVHHFDDPLNPAFDINFGICDYYFYEGITKTNNNAFNLFWRRTINQIDTGKMLVAYFNLDEGDIATLSLSDKIRIDNSWWTINRVIDYNANDLQLTKVELMSADTEINLVSFKTKNILSDEPIAGPITPLIDNYYEQNNNNPSKGKTVIKGVGNTVLPGVSAIVVGDDGLITEDGYWYGGEKVETPLDAEAPNPRVYRALISQTGTSAPTEDVVFENSLGGSITWSYTTTGSYTATLNGLMGDAITNFMGQVHIPGDAVGNVSYSSANACIVISRVASTGTATNGILAYSPIEIFVYS